MVKPRTVDEEEEIYEELNKYLWNIGTNKVHKKIKKDIPKEVIEEYRQTKNEELVYNIYRWRQIKGSELQRIIRLYLKPASDYRTVKRHIQNLQDRDMINPLDKKKILSNSKIWEIIHPAYIGIQDHSLDRLKELNEKYENR
jgi:hypothetical protein